jgi:hypothetical protein
MSCGQTAPLSGTMSCWTIPSDGSGTMSSGSTAILAEAGTHDLLAGITVVVALFALCVTIWCIDELPLEPVSRRGDWSTPRPALGVSGCARVRRAAKPITMTTASAGR